MSINTYTNGDVRHSEPPLLRGEELITGPYTADVELKVPASLTGPKRIENAAGRIWVTDQRVILISSIEPSGGASYDAPPALTSIVVPFPYLNSAKFNLPLFSPNNILLSFQPDPSSQSLPEPGRGGKIEAKVTVGEGAGHGIWKMIEGERERWLEIQRQENVLPTYSAGSKQGERRLL